MLAQPNVMPTTTIDPEAGRPKTEIIPIAEPQPTTITEPVQDTRFALPGFTPAEPPSGIITEPIDYELLKELAKPKHTYIGAEPTEEGAFDPLFDPGKTRKEISDEEGQYAGGEKGTPFNTIYGSLSRQGSKSVYLPEVFKQTGLYEKYPWLKDVQLFPSMSQERGSFSNGHIFINKDLPASDAKDVILHEIQHAIQEREGFAKGGSPEVMSKANIEQIGSLLEARIRSKELMGMEVGDLKKELSS
jgi:hypothetical protein